MMSCYFGASFCIIRSPLHAIITFCLFSHLYESFYRNGQGQSLDEMKHNAVCIRSDGLVTWSVQGKVDTICPLKLEQFPWDQQVSHWGWLKQ